MPIVADKILCYAPWFNAILTFDFTPVFLFNWSLPHWQILTQRPSDAIWQHRFKFTLQWRHNGHDSLSNHQPHDCLFNRLFWRRSKKTSKLRVTGLCAGNSPVTVEFPAQMASYAENVSIWWRHHDIDSGNYFPDGTNPLPEQKWTVTFFQGLCHDPTRLSLN